MQVSTDLPCGLSAVREHIAHRGETRLPMNVSAEADAAYIAEKKLNVGPVILKSWPIGNCSRCHGVIHDAPFLSNEEPGQFCSHACRDNEERTLTRKTRRRTRHFKECKQCGRRFLARRSDQEFHTPKCRVRWNRSHPNVTHNCTDLSETRINTGENGDVFAVPPVLAQTHIPDIPGSLTQVK